ncbi:O-acetylserine dependent cystathionine beta-synthase [Salinibacillus kushneri]|uniref:O-acetylserine dependent cystathionine beta-synthase n=1 Tax=Salinibacillus kushneri TaxID=237682 RepID=A0A1I0DMV9_9BACI|nr:cysteine synthase family protein [Salinibacillus kushneri]SET33680.1 O-acetylserine dependent cystathionine beta-synthase [Salinibacillus kushneri]
MEYVQNVQELIGETPLIEIHQFDIPENVRIFAKLEYFNPGGSIKDRLGKKLLDEALRSGKLKTGGTIIEPTAGNTGIGLALAAIGMGIRVIFVVPEKFSMEKQELMRALGAEIVHTRTEDGMKGAISKTEELLKEIPGSYSPKQFSNPNNPKAYFETLGPEIYRQLDGNVDVFIAGGGTGGTFMGTAEYLKTKKTDLKTVIVEPEGSILNGGEAGSHDTEGIGMEFIPEYMNPQYFDAIYTISDSQAFARVKDLSSKAGLLVGSSSGAAFQAALYEAEHASPGTNIITVFPDSSERYLSNGIYQYKK